VYKPLKTFKEKIKDIELRSTLLLVPLNSLEVFMNKLRSKNYGTKIL
jgi:hypothetical protein